MKQLTKYFLLSKIIIFLKTKLRQKRLPETSKRRRTKPTKVAKMLMPHMLMEDWKSNLQFMKITTLHLGM